MDDETQKEYLFSAPDQYKFMSAGNIVVAGMNDGQDYADTKEAMDVMGMSEEEQGGE